MNTQTDIEDALDAYLECALWAETDRDEAPLDAKYCRDDFSQEAIDRARADVQTFFSRAEHMIAATRMAVQLEDNADESLPETLGHDLWLTRNGHGTGFWDREYALDIGEDLSNIAQDMGGCDVIEGDDGKLHFM